MKDQPILAWNRRHHPIHEKSAHEHYQHQRLRWHGRSDRRPCRHGRTHRRSHESRWPHGAGADSTDWSRRDDRALEKGAAGRSWQAVAEESIPYREIAEAIGRRLKLPAVSIPADVLMVPGYFWFLANLVTLDTPASNVITRQMLGWTTTQPGLFADMDNGHYFPAS